VLFGLLFKYDQLPLNIGSVSLVMYAELFTLQRFETDP